MGYSKLAIYKKQSPFYYARKSKTIDTIVIHHFAGTYDLDAYEAIAMGKRSRETSAHYAIDNNGHIGCFCDESLRPWTTGPVDDYAITIELANDEVGGDWHVSDLVIDRCIDLCVDICQRLGIKECTYTGNSNGTIELHCWHAATACPGPYLKSQMPYIAKEIQKKLDAGETPQTLYAVQVGAFLTKAKAYAYAEQIKKKGVQCYVYKSGLYNRVQCGAFKNKAGAVEQLKRLKNIGFSGYIIEK